MYFLIIRFTLSKSLFSCVILLLFSQSSEGLHSDGAGYPDYVELSAKHHALEAIEVFAISLCTT